MDSKRITFKPSKIKESKIIREDEIQEYEDMGYDIKKTRGLFRAYKQMAKWEEFEEETRRFLDILGFQHVNKSPVEIGGHNVDAIGGCDDTFLIIECKTRQKIIDSPKMELEKFNGWRSDIIKAVKIKYPDYQSVKFVFCTDFALDTTAKSFAKQNDIEVWDANYIREYQSLFPILGDSTKYHVLYEMGCNPKHTEDFYVAAFRISQRNRQIYNFFIEPEVLLKVAYVFRRTSPAREKAYQRPLKSGRLDRIRKFLEEENGMFINNIILNFKEPLEFTQNKDIKNLPHYLELGTLKIPNSYCSAEIIDGQHRTYGFTHANKAKKELKLNVAALDNSSELERATFFIKINKEQKPVPPDLLWDLAGEIEPHTDSGKISNIVKRLNKESPFKGTISIPSETITTRNIPIKMANFCNGIEDRELLKIFKTENDLLSALKTFFSIVEKLFNYDWNEGKKGFVCNNAGVNVMLRIFRKILMSHDNVLPSKHKLEEIMRPISKGFAKKYYKKGKPNRKKLGDLRKMCASEAGRGDTEKELWQFLVEAIPSYAETRRE
jgi:DNA sulfur modification protein DndB